MNISLEKDEPRYNRLLLQESGFFRKFKFESGTGYVRDVSSFPFLVEELVSLAATDIAIEPHSLAAESVDLLPQSLRQRVITIDTNERCLEQRNAIMAPLLDEFHVEMKPPGHGAVGLCYSDKTLKEVQDSIPDLHFHLHTFLLGLEYELQIAVDLMSIRESINVLRKYSRNPTSRANLAILAGIFGTYKPQTLQCLEVSPTANERLIELFQEFVQDETCPPP